MNESFKSIKLTDLIPSRALGFDLFLFFPENKKFIKYISKDDIIDNEIIMRMKTRCIHELFVNREDMELYQKYLAKSLKYRLTNSAHDNEESARIMKQAARNIFENISPQSNQSEIKSWCDDVIGLTNAIVENLSGDNLNEFKEKLSGLIEGDRTLGEHSLAVSVLAVTFGMALGIYHGCTLRDLAVGGLLHDVGFIEIPRQVVFKYLHNQKLTSEELALLIKHPQLGADMVKSSIDSPIITNKVIKIILEHHENIRGTGYPRGISNMKQSYLARIVGVADNVAKDVINREPLDFRFSILRCAKNDEAFDCDLLKQVMKVI
ncbi:MAG: HD domain-containing protein [Bacteriovoracaceae bacterium]|nr:HD domain-containing protein [Bacteriovoracaceae bacterium]